MDEQTIIKVLTEAGGNLWEKNGKRRIYFSASTVMGLDVNRYGTGNISGADIKGERISNSEARRIMDCKFFYDVIDGKFYSSNTERLHTKANEAKKEFFDSMRAKLQ